MSDFLHLTGTPDDIGERIERLGELGVKNISSTLYTIVDKHGMMREISSTVSGVSWELVLKNGVWPQSLDLNVNLARLHSPLAAPYNAYNCTAAAGAALFEGLTLDQVSRGIASFSNVPGRLERERAVNRK